MPRLHDRSGAVKAPATDGAEVAGTIAGGYLLIPSRTLCLVAEGIRSGSLRPSDVHALLAVGEVAERRKFAKVARFDVSEVASLLGVGLARAGSAIKRLMRAGAVRWSPRAATLACEPSTEAGPGFKARVDAYGKARLIPFPRRMARHLLDSARPTLTWTALASAGRMLYRHGPGLRAMGTCSASWICSWAPLDERSVRRSRAELDAQGWYRRVAAPSWAHRRGQLGRVEMGWSAPALSGARRRKRRGLSPPSIRPAPEAGNGDQRRRTGLAKIEREQLRDRASLASLFSEAVAAGFVADAPEPCLRFCAAAHHAATSGARNPAGVFVWMLRRGLRDPRPEALRFARSMQESIRPSPRPRPGARSAGSLRAVAAEGDRRSLRPRGMSRAHDAAVRELEAGGDRSFQDAVDFLMARGVPCVEARAVARIKFGVGPAVRYTREVA